MTILIEHDIKICTVLNILQIKVLPLKAHHHSSPHYPFSLQIDHKRKEIYYFSELSKDHKVISVHQLYLTSNLGCLQEAARKG